MQQLLQAERDALLKPLSTVTSIVGRRSTLPILFNVLIKKEGELLSFTGTDLEIQIMSCQTEGFSGTDFALTVAAKKITDILRAIPDKTVVTFEENEGCLMLRAGKSRFQLQTLPVSDFPQLAVDKDLRMTLKFKQAHLKSLLTCVQYAMAQQDIRYYLNGLLLATEANTIKLVATDGHRLAWVSTELNLDFGEKSEVILPRKTVLELHKLLSDTDDEVTIDIAGNQICFSLGKVTVHTKIIDGKFPDYHRVMPVGNNKLMVVNRALLLCALQRASILSNEKLHGVRFVLTEGALKIICSNTEQEEAQEELDVSYTGTPLDIAFNIQYVLDILMHSSDENLHFLFGEPSTSVLITPHEDHHFKYIIMPMRI